MDGVVLCGGGLCRTSPVPDGRVDLSTDSLRDAACTPACEVLWAGGGRLWAKFCFLTDPAKLESQQADQAFRPMPAPDGNDRHQVTNLSSAAGTGPVLAICDGLKTLRAANDNNSAARAA